MSSMNRMSTVDVAHDAHFARLGGLVAKAEAAPDPDAQLVLLIDRHERPLFTYLFTFVRDRDAALDYAQDAFLRAYENLQRGRPVNGNWLYRVARNRAVDEFRRKRRVQREAELPEEQIPVSEDQSLGVAVWHALEQLAPTDREVLYLHAVAGFKTKEVAAMLGVKGSAVRQRLYRARERFRQLYERKRY